MLALVFCNGDGGSVGFDVEYMMSHFDVLWSIFISFVYNEY